MHTKSLWIWSYSQNIPNEEYFNLFYGSLDEYGI